MPEIPPPAQKGRRVKFSSLKVGDRLWFNGVPCRKLADALISEVWTGRLLTMNPDDVVTT